ncbi:hypothetical protein yfred0001_37640 [Yersinia frederiksenii ATCC 33641]|nr:hypothetical protein yfred0001_37640 [Yersinia frederiksenii ATCC 33641]
MVISNKGFILLGLTTLSFSMAAFNIIHPYLGLWLWLYLKQCHRCCDSDKTVK